MGSQLAALVDYLRDPRLVSSFQLKFGVQLIPSKNSNEGRNGFRSDTCQTGPVTYDEIRQKELVNAKFRTNYDGGDVTERKPGETGLRHRRELSGSSFASESADDSGGDSDSIQPNYIIGNMFWYYLFSFGAGLGYELFYASFFPFWFWNIDGAVGRRMVLLWVIIMYVGQALKDVIKWPRPSSPPVVVLEPDYAIEYGMPSTHAMVGFALPFSMVLFTVNRYEYPVWCGIAFAICWCVLVCGSRLYLGMHSVLDIVAGLLLAAVLMIILVPLVDFIDQFHLTSLYSPLVTVPLIVLMAKFYPKPERWSPARGDTCTIMGSGAGILLGSWLNYQLGIIRGPGLPPPFPIIWPESNVLGLAALRLSLGILCIIASRAIGTVIVFSLVCYLHKLDPRDPTTRIRASVEVPYKIITYLGMGITITYLSPAVFQFLNIQRATMFTEV